MFFSQQLEDKYLYENFLNYKNGFFIELGAMDGFEYSNTLFFEKYLNWHGILIEPTINQYEKLIQNRPNCYNFNYAIYINEGEENFLGDHALGGIAESMSDWHKKGWKIENKKSTVKTIPMNKLLKNIKIELVDLFSIDVEGGEIYVLKTFDWKIPVYAILIEGNYTATRQEQLEWMSIPNKNNLVVDQYYVDKINACTDILIKNNFKFYSKIGDNEVWINEKNKRIS